jgi:hypothetical protein
MWAFLSRRFRQWVLLVVAVPVVAWVLDRLGAASEQRGGETSTSRNLRKAGVWVSRQQRGPGSRRRRRALG